MFSKVFSKSRVVVDLREKLGGRIMDGEEQVKNGGGELHSAEHEVKDCGLTNEPVEHEEGLEVNDILISMFSSSLGTVSHVGAALFTCAAPVAGAAVAAISNTCHTLGERYAGRTTHKVLHDRIDEQEEIMETMLREMITLQQEVKSLRGDK